MDTVPEFSVIVPTYNRPKLLREALLSVRDQTEESWECVVIDDHGHVNLEWVPTLDRRIGLHRTSENSGLANARNVGVDLASGKYLVFVDDDDILTPSRLRVGRFSIQGADIGLCWHCDLDLPVSDRRPKRVLEGNVYNSILDLTAPPIGCMTIRRSDFIPFDTEFRASQDLDWWIRVTSRFVVSTLPDWCYLVRSHSGVRHGNSVRARITASLALIAKHRGYFAKHKAALAYRWFRIGQLLEEVEQHQLAQRAYVRSICVKANTRAAVWLVGSIGRDMERVLVRRNG